MNSSRQRRRAARIGAAVLGGTLGSVAAAEIGLRWVGPDPREPVVRYTIRRSSKLFSATLDDSSPLFYTYDGIRVAGDRLSISYPVDRWRTVSLAKPPETFRIAAVGDSLTEQWNLPGYENYTNHLEDALRTHRPGVAHEVLPLGVGGYNTWQERHLFERRLGGLEADVLLLQYCGNDGDVLRLEPRAPGVAVPPHGWPSHEIVGERFGVPDYGSAALAGVPSRLLWTVRYRLGARHALHGYRQVAGDGRQREALLWFRELAALRGIPLLVVVFPLFDDDYAQPESRYAAGLLDELGIAWLDLRPALAAHAPLASLRRDLYHPSNEGYRVAALAILDHLEARGLLPPP